MICFSADCWEYAPCRLSTSHPKIWNRLLISWKIRPMRYQPGLGGLTSFWKSIK